MSRTITRRPRAKADLIEIWSYIASANESAADRLLEKIGAVLEMLADHPEAGRVRPELRPGLRSFPVGTYIVFYEPMTEGIELIRVLSGYLDLEEVDVL